MMSPGSSQSAGLPDPSQCASDEDLGKLHHDTQSDIWYECFLDTRRSVYTWAALPPIEPA